MLEFLTLIASLLLLIPAAMAAPLYEMPADTQSRWSSFENPKGEKGAGGVANRGGKGAAFEPVAPGETKVLMDVQSPGTIHRMWFTLRNRTPRDLRAYVLRFYWDAAATPAVEVPFGDFFGAILGQAIPFENELFANPEGRSFNCYIPMPFRNAAKVTFTNESSQLLDQLFYDIDYTVTAAQPENTLYFHAIWRRERPTELGKDFEILPKVSGRGRFLGAHLGVIGNPAVEGWWGEGEVKMYLDGDAGFPTIVGTGTEDYIGTAYGQGQFAGRYQGSLLVDNTNRKWAFYRYHVPDPVYFHQDIRVTIQQMGGADKKVVQEMLKKGVEVRPVTVHGDGKMYNLLEMDPEPDLLTDTSLPDGWTNMYRRDDVCAVALFYLDAPENGLPRLAPVEERTAGL